MSSLDIIVLTAPSGAGKTTIARHVMEAMPEVEFSVSATTRAPRPSETDGEDYHFLSEERFHALADEGELLEYEEVYPGDYYGTLRSEVEDKAASRPVLLDIDVRGALNVKRIYGDDALVIFVAPPSMAELRRRLAKRGTESDDSFRSRIARAEMEMEKQDQCDAVVINDELDRAVQETLGIVRQFLNR
jgi:guanylate kinase